MMISEQGCGMASRSFERSEYLWAVLAAGVVSISSISGAYVLHAALCTALRLSKRDPQHSSVHNIARWRVMHVAYRQITSAHQPYAHRIPQAIVSVRQHNRLRLPKFGHKLFARARMRSTTSIGPLYRCWAYCLHPSTCGWTATNCA